MLGVLETRVQQKSSAAFKKDEAIDIFIIFEVRVPLNHEFLSKSVGSILYVYEVCCGLSVRHTP